MSVPLNFHGLMPDLSNDDYHATGALGSTQIKSAARSLAHFRAMMMKEIKISKSLQAAFDLGYCAHQVALEQTTHGFIVLPENAPRRPTSAQVNAKKPSPETLEQIQWWAKFDASNDGKIVLDVEDFLRLQGLFESFCNHPIAPTLVSESKVEQSFFTLDEETGLWIKARPDGLCQSDDMGDYIFDFKTTSRGTARKSDFQRQIANLGYDISAAHYIAVVEAVTGRKVKDFFWIVQELSEPFALSVFKASDELLRRAELKRRSLLNQIAIAQETKIYPAYPPVIDEIDLPKWATEDDVEFGEAI